MGIVLRKYIIKGNDRFLSTATSDRGVTKNMGVVEHRIENLRILPVHPVEEHWSILEVD